MFIPSDEIFSCKDSFDNIEWNPREGITPVKFIAAGNKTQIYAISRLRGDRVKGGHQVLIFDQETQDWRKWGKKGAIRIAISPLGIPWILTDEKKIYRASKGGWKRVPGKASSISIGADGSIFILGPKKDKLGYKIY